MKSGKWSSRVSILGFLLFLMVLGRFIIMDDFKLGHMNPGEVGGDSYNLRSRFWGELCVIFIFGEFELTRIYILLFLF